MLEVWVRRTAEAGVVEVQPWTAFSNSPGAEGALIWLGEPEEPLVGCYLTEVRGEGFQNSAWELVAGEACEDSQLRGS